MAASARIVLPFARAAKRARKDFPNARKEIPLVLGRTALARSFQGPKKH
jgi:hypothetical protein